MKQGILLINLGTPKLPTIRATRDYLRHFLMDKRVIDLPFLLRFLLVYGFILPLRPSKTAKAYQAIWTSAGSPLLVQSQALALSLQQALPETQVVLGMRYGEPSLETALLSLQDCDSLTLLPLYPQYSSAASGSAIEAVLQRLAVQTTIPSLHLIRDFYQHPTYIKAQAACIQEQLPQGAHLLLSYHGIPERQLLKAGRVCYKSQCLKTSALLATALGLQPKDYTTSFQSRLGKTPWIQPYTDKVLIELATQGVKDLAVACPSFVCDCLETLEEIALRAKEQWLSLGGRSFTYLSCMNSHPLWIQALTEITAQSKSL